MFMRAQHTLLLFVDYLFAKTILLAPSTTYPRNRIRYSYRVHCTLQKQNVAKSITIDTTHCRFKFQIDRDTSDRNACTARGATACTMYVGLQNIF